MKKIVIASLALFSSLAFAASVTVEAQNQIGEKGAANQTQTKLEVKESLNDTFSIDASITQAVQANTHALSTRDEVGVTGTLPVGPVAIYTRVGTGAKYNNTTHFGYYLVEPGVSYAIGPVTAKVGFRFRDAYNETNQDLSRTYRYGLAYAVTKKDTVGVRYDRQTGDSQNHSYFINYTRSF